MFARRQFLGSLLSTGILPWMLRAEEIPQAKNKKEVSWLAEDRSAIHRSGVAGVSSLWATRPRRSVESPERT
jgi:hypothetical protein